MRKIVQEYIDNPKPHLGSGLTTMEKKYADLRIEQNKATQPRPDVVGKQAIDRRSKISTNQT